MTRAALILAVATMAPGCFYLDPINQRPSVSIRQDSSAAADRGSTVALTADTSDPDGDAVFVAWQAYACTAGAGPAPDCDAAPFSTGDLDAYAFVVPITRADGATPVLAVRVLLDAEDDRGAPARPEQQLVIPIGDAPPVLALRQVSLHDFVIDSHISLFADVSDPDDGPTATTLAWTVFAPTVDATFELVDEPPPVTADPAHRGEAKALVAHATGAWDVRVVATDPIGAMTTADFAIVVAADEPPCIAAEQPIAQPGETLPLFAPTDFEVPVVTDDLDTYPPVTGDPDAGAAAFSWTLATNGGTRAPLAITGNAVALDPASFQAGDVLELRVEIADRQPRQASFAACPDADATCAFDLADPTCTQRQTWRLEVQ